MCYHYLYSHPPEEGVDLRGITFPIYNAKTGEKEGEYEWKGEPKQEIVDKFMKFWK